MTDKDTVVLVEKNGDYTPRLTIGQSAFKSMTPTCKKEALACLKQAIENLEELNNG